MAKKGFTLIELLVVIAVLGILSAVVLVAINPAERLRSARDAGAKNSIGQIATALEAYFTANNGTYPPYIATNTYLGLEALTSGEFLKNLPTPPSGSSSTDTVFQYRAYQDTGASTACTSTSDTCVMARVWYTLESSSATGEWCYDTEVGQAKDVANCD